MSTRAVRKSDYVRGYVHVRAHLLRAGTDCDTLCGDPPTSLEFTRTAGDYLGLPVRVVPCARCLCLVDIHVAPLWYAPSVQGDAFGLCGRRLLGPAAELATDQPSGSRLISIDEAASWVANDHPDLWRLCRVCEVAAPRHVRANQAWSARLAARAEREREQEAKKLELAAARDSYRAEAAREMGVSVRGLGRRKAARVLPASAQVSPAISELARRDAEDRREYPVEICDAVEDDG